jgi:hypothetical protein
LIAQASSQQTWACRRNSVPIRSSRKPSNPISVPYYVVVPSFIRKANY